MAKKLKPYTRILGKFLHKLGYRDLSKNDIAVTKSLLLDYIGYSVASATTGSIAAAALTWCLAELEQTGW